MITFANLKKQIPNINLKKSNKPGLPQCVVICNYTSIKTNRNVVWVLKLNT